MNYYINYANKKFENSQIIAVKQAKKKANVDKIINYNESSIDKEFIKKNLNIFSQKRGNGYWLWKPYIIKKTIDIANFNDYILYVDSGAYIKNDVSLLISSLEKTKQDLMCFQLPYYEYSYSKRDAFILMKCDYKKYYSTLQNMATIVLIRKTKKTVRFVNDWLKFSQDERIITDIKNTCGKNNYKGFIENRHDQTVFSLLTKKYGYKPFRDPTQYGNIYKKDFSNSDYPQMFYLHRCSKFKTKIGVILYRKLVNIVNYLNKVRKK